MAKAELAPHYAIHPAARRGPSSLRQRILAFVCSLIILSLLGSTISLYRITEVNRLLDVINRVSVPLGRLFTQMQSDAELYHREFERSLGANHWKDPRWVPRPVPRWISDVLDSEISRSADLIRDNADWVPEDSRNRWQDWAAAVSGSLSKLRDESVKLQVALEQKNEVEARRAYSRWKELLEEWKRQLQWGAGEYDHSFRQTFSLAESRVSELRTGLEMILLVVVALSLMLMWLGERALRPLGELTRLAREITRRGLKKEDKSSLPEISLSRTDEVSQLAREFHNMATALLEREKTVEAQKHRLQEQNNLLREIGELNENILNSIESVLVVTDLHGIITQCNPVAERWLEASAERILGKSLDELSKLRQLFSIYPEARLWLAGLSRSSGSASRHALRPPLQAGSLAARIEGRVYGGHLMPLRPETDSGAAGGAILVLDDLTEDVDLQERLSRAENMAAVGRLSAQVAHEVRNPLHSIGLEAEMAVEMANRLGSANLKQSLNSILGSVDRLEKITENYLKLSRLSAGEKALVDLGEVLESVLATYATVCEAQRVRVDWKREARASLTVWGDRELLEQVLGNLFRNSLQALENAVPAVRERRVGFSLGAAEGGRVWLRIEDNGPGIPEDVRSRLFVPFVTTRAQGTGLGLSFVKKVIEDHDGVVSLLDSGSGACFEILLPSAAGKAAAQTHPEVPRNA